MGKGIRVPANRAEFCKQIFRVWWKQVWGSWKTISLWTWICLLFVQMKLVIACSLLLDTKAQELWFLRQKPQQSRLLQWWAGLWVGDVYGCGKSGQSTEWGASDTSRGTRCGFWRILKALLLFIELRSIWHLGRIWLNQIHWQSKQSHNYKDVLKRLKENL